MFFCRSRGSEPLRVSKSDILRGIITEKLSSAAREILAVVERTVADYEQEAAGFRQEIGRQRRQLELLQPREKPNKRALVPDLYSHEVVVVSEQQLTQDADVEEAESQSPPWSRDDDDDKQPTATSRPHLEDPKDQDCPTPPSISKTNILREIITEKLSSAAQEILEAVGRTVGDEEEEEASGVRQTRQLELLQPRVRLHRPDLQNHEVVVVGEEPEEQQLTQTDVEEAESQNLPWSRDDDEDDDDDKRPPTNRRLRQVDQKDPDYEISSRSVSSRVPSVRKRPRSLRISDLQNHLNLKIRLLEDSQIEVLSTAVFKKSPIRELKCSRGLQEADFLNILRSTFPQLANNEPFDIFMTDQSKKLRPLKVKRLTPEEIHTTIRSTGNSALYIRLKEGKKESRVSESAADETGLQTSSSTSQLNVDPEEEETENMESRDDREEALDAGDYWKPDPDPPTNKPSSKKKAKMDVEKAEESKLFCKVCGVWYRFQGSLIKHAWSHVDEQQDVCGVCGGKFESVEELKEHLRSYQNVHSCSDCGKTFVSILSLKCHTAKHTGNSLFKCNVCNKTFTNQASLNTHFWSHVEEKPHKCDVCQKAFGLKAQLAVHRRTHTSQDKYQCDLCKKSFNLRRSLTQHRLIHSEERHYACAVCEKRFKLEGSLKAHMKIHTDRDRTFLCHICCKTFLSKSSLMAHIKIHSTERPFVCSTCGKSFAVTYDLKKHMRIHTGETPYECSECGRSFRQKTNLDSHVKIHLGIKQFICGVCGKACSRREHLKVHMRTHNGERPYKCFVCDKTFTQSHCLKTHMKSHHTDENPFPDNQTSEDHVPDNQTDGNPEPENQTLENPVPENQTDGNPEPENQTEENPEPENQTDGNPVPENQTEENPVPENQTDGNPEPENQTNGNPVPENQTEENPAPENQTDEKPVPTSSES